MQISTNVLWDIKFVAMVRSVSICQVLINACARTDTAAIRTTAFVLRRRKDAPMTMNARLTRNVCSLANVCVHHRSTRILWMEIFARVS